MGQLENVAIGANRVGSNHSPYQILTIADFLGTPIPPREFIMSPWLATGSINFVNAYRGTGKTFFCMQLAIQAALGEPFLHWKCSRPYSVLYVDGEMNGASLQSRFNYLLGNQVDRLNPDNLRIFAHAMQVRSIPDLTSRGDHDLLVNLVGDSEFVIFDNLSCLARGAGNENDAESWLPVQDLATRLRREGKTVIFVHHCGKSSAQRGTSKREDTADIVIHLLPTRYKQTTGACFKVHFEKTRDIYGSDKNSRTVMLQPDPETGTGRWIVGSSSADAHEEIIALVQDGLRQSEIADKLDVSRSTVSRAVRDAVKDGELTSEEAERSKSRAKKRN